MSICEDCTERYLAVRAKALYNYCVVGFLAEASPKYFHVHYAICSFSSGYIVHLDL